MGHETKQQERREHTSRSWRMQINPRVYDCIGRAFNWSIEALIFIKRVR
jgi:hypothetical protein